MLGGFDGLHVGHETLLVAAQKYGYPIGLTTILGGKKGGDVFTLSERKSRFLRAGLSFVYEMNFTERMRNTSALDFIGELTRTFPLQAVVCGNDFRFGRGAEGDVELLKNTLTCPVLCLPLKQVGGEKVSSTQIKNFLSEGGMSEVDSLLLQPYSVMGRVEHGRAVGRSMGFPTVNIAYPDSKYPLKEGVYGGYAVTNEGKFPALIHFGSRPTFGVPERKLEAYLVDFEGDLYGSEVEVVPTEYFREIITFPSAEKLQEQIAEDIKRLRYD